MKHLFKLLPALVAFPAVCLFPRHAAAQTVTWIGGNDTWTVPGDWTGGAAPGSGTNAIIDSGTANLPTSVRYSTIRRFMA